MPSCTIKVLVVDHALGLQVDMRMTAFDSWHRGSHSSDRPADVVTLHRLNLERELSFTSCRDEKDAMQLYSLIEVNAKELDKILA